MKKKNLTTKNEVQKFQRIQLQIMFKREIDARFPQLAFSEGKRRAIRASDRANDVTSSRLGEILSYIISVSFQELDL